MADTPKAAEEKAPETKWTVDEIISGAEGFGSTPAAVAGALHLAQQSTTKKYFTKAEVEKALEKFNAREVPAGAGEEVAS